MSYLAVCAIYRDEAHNLREWLEFHRLVGVERFFLYNHLSTDDHREVLAPYVERGIAVVHEWSEADPPQMAAYLDCVERHGAEARWIAFIDLDEFLFSPTGAPVPDLLREYEQWPGVGVNWAHFGSSGHLTRPPGLVIETHLWRAADGPNHLIKTIADPRRVTGCHSPHFVLYDEGTAVDENHRPIDGRPRSKTENVSFARLRVNHYAIKSEEEFRRKVARGSADGVPKQATLTAEQIERRAGSYNDVEDRTILMYLPRLRAALRQPAAARAGSQAMRRSSP
jgi:hypothetical protein